MQHSVKTTGSIVVSKRLLYPPLQDWNSRFGITKVKQITCCGRKAVRGIGYLTLHGLKECMLHLIEHKKLFVGNELIILKCL